MPRKDIPEDLLRIYLDEKLRFSMDELIDLSKLINTPGFVMYSNNRTLFCLENFESHISQLLITPFKDLPLLAGNLEDKDTFILGYKKTYEWMLRKG